MSFSGFAAQSLLLSVEFHPVVEQKSLWLEHPLSSLVGPGLDGSWGKYLLSLKV